MSKAQGIAQSANQGQFKNRIINGAMAISQRNGTSSVAATNSGYTLDRWRTEVFGGGAYTVQQSTNAPVGFTNSALITVTTADASIASTDYYDFQQYIEGFNVADLGWGTANAQPVTLSFWVSSSLTGTFAGSISNSASNRSYVFSYTISSANTWEQKTVTIAGDTSGTWLTNNGRGVCLTFDLGNGSTYTQSSAGSWVATYAAGLTSAVKVISTLSATWQVTGVQLEKGSTATSFDYLDYGRQLQQCQRYYETGATYCGAGGVGVYASAPFCVTKRATPTVVVTASGAWTAGATGTVSGGVISSVMFIMYNPANVHLGATWTSSAEL